MDSTVTTLDGKFWDMMGLVYIPSSPVELASARSPAALASQGKTCQCHMLVQAIRTGRSLMQRGTSWVCNPDG